MTTTPNELQREQCAMCNGNGGFRWNESDGRGGVWENGERCEKCDGMGYIYLPQPATQGDVPQTLDVEALKDQAWAVLSQRYEIRSTDIFRTIDHLAANYLIIAKPPQE